MKTLCFFAIIFLSCLVSVRAASPVIKKFASCQVVSAGAAQAATATAEAALISAVRTDNVPTVAGESTEHLVIVEQALATRDAAVARWKELVKTACSARFAWMWMFVVLLAAKRL